MVNQFSDDNLATVMDKNKFLPDRIYNMDETGAATIQHYKSFVMIAVMLTCQVLNHQRDIMGLYVSLQGRNDGGARGA